MVVEDNADSRALLERTLLSQRYFLAGAAKGARALEIALEYPPDLIISGGIMPEILGRIFEPYFSTKEAEQGTGIGLFMSKTLMEKKMNGTLGACSTDGGAHFRIEV